MRTVYKRMLGAAILAACGLQLAAAQDRPPSIAAPAPSQAAKDSYSLRDILDTSRPLEVRRAAWEQYEQAANAGDRYQQYILGSLYRVGKQIPGALVARDDAKARLYLSNAAAHGELHAMAKMAEILLEEKDAFNAMVWAQVYGHYALESDAQMPSSSKRGGYFADLLHRISTVLDSGRMPEVSTHVAAFLDAHDGDIRSGMNATQDDYESGDTHGNNQTPTRFLPMVAQLAQHRRDCFVEYLVEFAADGSAKQAWLLDALPDVSVGEGLRTVAMRARVNAVQDSVPSRLALVPLDFTLGNYSVRQAK
jgi:hypothetical protein